MKKPLDILHFSIHGLIRGENLELGRDADTGGQCLYVLELVKALARDDRVARATLVTRRVYDPKVSDDYAAPDEDLGNGASIHRIEAGTRRYLRKEVIWRHLDAFIDGTLAWLRREKRVPDLIHAHYADAGYVGRQVAAVLGVPFCFTGHSLGRVKRGRLVESGLSEKEIERKYNLAVRIEAEELSLEAAYIVCTSTRQEVDSQYALYDRYAEESMRVIPPGVDLSRFDGQGNTDAYESVDAKLQRFLRDPSRPAVFTIARADERKNLVGLIRAFGENAWLREHANLIVIGGNRETLAQLNPGARKVWKDLLHLIDDLDLYGICAVPKTHKSPEVPEFYRWTADHHGVFVNPAFTEPFGLTLLEAAAAGLPLVATNDGGPRDILANCENGSLIDPNNPEEMGTRIEEILRDASHYQSLSEKGHRLVRKHYSWDAHVQHYLDELEKVLPERPVARPEGSRKKMADVDYWVAMDLPPALEDESGPLIDRWRNLFSDHQLGLIFSTGLTNDAAYRVIEKWDMPKPTVLITGLGAEIHYGWQRNVIDEVWRKQAKQRWDRSRVVEALSTLDGLQLQPEKHQHPLKVSYTRDAKTGPRRTAIQRTLRADGVSAKALVSSECFVDVLPIRTGKDVALRYLENKWGIDPAKIYCFGTYGNDAAMVRGRNLSAIAADADAILRRQRSRPRLYHCEQPGLAGFLEGLEHYGLLDGTPPPMPTDQYTSEDEQVSAIEINP